MKQVLNYGGGRQTVAMCVLVVQGKLPRPDHVVIADTGREKPSTWEYLDEITRPLMATIGIEVEVAPRELAYVDLYSHQGDLLIPAYTLTGKFSAFCSTEWKARVIGRYFANQGIPPADRVNAIGFAYDERGRIKGTEGRTFPLVDMMLTKADCRQIITAFGLPLPPPSSCSICPNMANSEWRYIRDYYPTAWEQACVLDEEIREEDKANGGTGVWLHFSRQPLRIAPIDDDDGRDGKLEGRQCGLGLCMV